MIDEPNAKVDSEQILKEKYPTTKKVVQFQLQLNQLFLLYDDGTMVEGEIEMSFKKQKNGLPVTTVNVVRTINLPDQK